MHLYDRHSRIIFIHRNLLDKTVKPNHNDNSNENDERDRERAREREDITHDEFVG